MKKGRTARLLAIALVTTGMVIAQPAHAGEQPGQNDKPYVQSAAKGSAADPGARARPQARALAADEPPPGLGTATANNGNRIDIMVSNNTFLEYNFWTKDAGWATRTTIDGPAAGIWYKPSLTWTPDGKRLDVFVTGNVDGHVYLRTWTASSGWGGWIDLGGVLLFAPSAQWTNNGNRVDIFGIGTDYRLYQKSWTSTSGWSDWGGFSGPSAGIASAPSITWTANAKRLDVFVVGANPNRLFQKFWSASSGWSGWYDLGGGLRSEPSASWVGDGSRIDVFAVGGDIRPYQKFWPAASGWSQWIGFDPTSVGVFLPPSISWAANGSRLDVFILDREGYLRQNTLTPPSTWTGWQYSG